MHAVRLTLVLDFTLEPITAEQREAHPIIKPSQQFGLVDADGCRMAWVRDVADAVDHLRKLSDDVQTDLGEAVECTFVPFEKE